MKTVVANRSDFFPPGGCPIALRSIRGDAPVQHEGDLTDIRHTHDFAELVVITSGAGIHWIDGTAYPVAGGDIFLIQGNIEHYFQERHALAMDNVMFDDFYLKRQLRTLRGLPGFNAFFLFEPTYRRRHRFQSRLHLAPESMPPLTRLLRDMESEINAQLAGGDLVLLAKVLEIFVFLSRAYSQNPNPKARSLCRLGEVISRLENGSAEAWTLRRLARIAAMAPSTLLPVFKEVTGYSPMDYLLRIRLSRASELLLNTEQSIAEISEACGFHDANYFSRQFRKRYNCSPRNYRSR